MARSVYTTTITVPIHASWKCKKCGGVNFALGTFAFEHEESSSSWLPSKHRETKAKAARLAQVEWAGELLQIISDPNNHAQDMRKNISMQNTRCTKCRKKTKWDKKKRSDEGRALLLWGGIFSLWIGTSPIVWLILFASFLAISVISFISERRWKKMMKNLPKKYTPVLGSLNPELIEYAEAHGKKILDPGECMLTVMKYDQAATSTTPKV